MAKHYKSEIKHFSNLEHIWWGSQTPAGQKRYDNKLDLLKKFCNLRAGVMILEIGCGDGEFTRRLLKLNCRIVATDITPAVVKKGKKNIKDKRIRFLVDNAENMKFKSGTFETVCGISILHHTNMEKVLKEVYRVLKPGGNIFFTEPNLLNPHIFAGLHIGKLRKKMEFSPNETALTRWQVEKMLKRIGFNQIRVNNYDFLHPYIPPSLIFWVERISNILEKLPIIKEISGSLIIYATKSFKPF